MESFVAYIVVGENIDTNRWEYLQTMNAIDGLWDTAPEPWNARLFGSKAMATWAADFCTDSEVPVKWHIREVTVTMGCLVD